MTKEEKKELKELKSLLYRNVLTQYGKRKLIVTYENLIQSQQKEIENAYWKGYIQKQNEAVEICKVCKYRDKARKLESNNQKLIEKLEEKETRIDELEERLCLIETYYDISDLDEIVKNDI